VVQNGKRKQTSYAWRNTTVGYALDAFYNSNVGDAQKLAQQWQDTNIAEGIGPNGKFSTADHRWFWASHGDTDMSKAWPYYYAKEDYQRCFEVKRAVDPNGVFSPNPFVVGWPETKPKHRAAAPAAAAAFASTPEHALDDAAFAKGHADRAKARAEAKGIDTAELFRSNV
jgi:hypothetical protein